VAASPSLNAFRVAAEVDADSPGVTIAASYVDSDASQSPSFTIDSAGTRGTVINNGDGTFTYSPNGAFGNLALGQVATDTFTYTLEDAQSRTATATVTIAVSGEDNVPY